jgi:hypothetical protein
VDTSDLSKLSESDLVMQQFHCCLNSQAHVPANAYRRNSSLYPLVCYVNNLIGALLSQNHEVVPIFVARAAEHMTQVPPFNEAVAAYYALVCSYLSQVVHHVRCAGSQVEFDPERIPASILGAGSQPAPNIAFDRDAPKTARPSI